jgi:23S rRNA (guanosine2251-2'-O)-methyltransferase
MKASSVVGGRRPVLEAVRAGRAVEVRVAREARRTPALREVLAAASRAGVRVVAVGRAELDATGVDHHGVAAEVRRPRDLGERDLSSLEFGTDDLVVLLDGIEDPQNLGAAARVAEAAGAAILVTRLRRAAPLSQAAVRASAGALIHLPHARVANIPRALERLKSVGFTVIGLSERAARDVYAEPCPPGRVALVVGAEGRGLSRLVRERCDLLVSVPMRGRVGSLNAASALAAVLFAYVVPARK